MLNLSAYPQCARILQYQRANLSEPSMNHYWAAACVASGQSDALLTEFGGFDFEDRSPANGKRLLARLEEFLTDRSPRSAGNYAFASDGLRSLLGSRGVKTSALKSEDDYWAASEILFPGHISRLGGFTSLYVQITSIPKKQRGALGRANLKHLPAEWLGKIVDRRGDLANCAAPEHAA
jgi:hypothetical protein